MDFEDFITLILFLIFIVSPFLKRKKSAKQGRSAGDGFSVVGKIKDALQAAVREAQAQAKQNRETGSAGQDRRPLEQAEEPQDSSFWDEIDDRDDDDFYLDDELDPVPVETKPVKEQPVFISIKKEHGTAGSPRPEAGMSQPLPRHGFGHGIRQEQCAGLRPFPGRARGLRNAVIWSEILGKPVALKD